MYPRFSLAHILSAITAGSLAAACGGTVSSTGDGRQNQDQGGEGGDAVSHGSTGGSVNVPAGGSGPSMGGAAVGGYGSSPFVNGGAAGSVHYPPTGGAGGSVGYPYPTTGGAAGAPNPWPGMVCDPFAPASVVCMTQQQIVAELRYPYTGDQYMPDAGPPRTDEEIASMLLPNGCAPLQLLHDGCCQNPSAGPMLENGQCCYAYCQGACCGRPLLVEGSARIAPAAARTDWLAALDDAGVVLAPDTTRAAIAGGWLEDALFEHASVASFARFALDLLGVGAPPELVAEAHRAALDEIEHARLCFALAARYGAALQGPGRLDVTGAISAPDLESAVVAAIEEGCVGETIAAIAAELQRDRARDPEARRALDRIAEDEARHSALAYRFVAWALALRPELRDRARRAFDVALQSRSFGGEETLPADQRSLFAAAGRLTPAEVRAVEDHAKRHLLVTARDALFTGPRESNTRVQPAHVC